MKAIGLLVGGFLGSLVVAVMADMVSEEIRGRLDRLPYAVLCLAIRRLPVELRADIGRDWQAELDHILRRAELYPVTRLVTGLRFAAGLLRTAPGIARSLALIRRSEGAQPVDAERPTRVLRTVDVVASVLLLLVLAPALAVIAIMIKLVDGGPVLTREGQGRRLKFRTTVISSGAPDGAVTLHKTDSARFWGPYDRRVTRLGHFLRRHSLNELPTLWSVLKGETRLFSLRV